MSYNFDVLILGGGPAGMSAGVYCARNNLSTAVLDMSILGGQPINYLELENYIGFPIVNSSELMEKFELHMDRFNVQKFPMHEIRCVDLLSDLKSVETDNGIFYAKTVIIATGAKPKKLGVKGEEEFLGRGVSYCAICDGAFYKGKTVAVIGGGNSALEEAIYLTNFAEKVYVIHYKDVLKADKVVQERVMQNQKIELILGKKVKEIRGDETVKQLIFDDSELDVDGVFVYIGLAPNAGFVRGQLLQDESGFIVTDTLMQTSVDGVYAIGDVRNSPLRQVVTAASDGAIAGVYAAKYIEMNSNELAYNTQ